MAGKTIRIRCPQLCDDKSYRIKLLFDNIDKWVSSGELYNLVKIFGGCLDNSATLNNKIEYLNDFCMRWDFRKKQANGGERWEIEDDEFVQERSKEIMELVDGLGLVNITEPIIVPDYILPLGGARMSNLLRCEYAQKLSANFDNKTDVIALSGKRKLDNVKKDGDGKTEYDIITESYAKDAGTEYDAINSGLERAFGLFGCKYTEEGIEEENHNSSWCIRKYESDNRVFSVAAPTTDFKRRANSMDTFEFFMDKFKISEGNKILLVTSCIYVPYQFLKFMKIAIEKDLLLDCVGVPGRPNEFQFSKTSNYLQEVKGTINAIKKLADEYISIL